MYVKEETEKARKRIRNLIIAIIMVILVLMGEVTYLYLNPTKDNTPDDVFEESIKNVVDVSEMPSITINNLNSEIKSLEFTDSVGSGLDLKGGKYTARIEENKAIISINDKEYEYVIKSPKSIVMGVLEEKYVTVYILSNEGKLYNVKFDLVKNSYTSCIYSISDIVAIDIDTGEVNIGNKKDFEPSVYFKTSNGKIFTSDKLVDDQKYFVLLLDN